MTPTAMTDIETVLSDRLIVVAGALGYDARTRVAWPNVEFSQPQDKSGALPYLSFSLMPAPARARSLDGGAGGTDDISGVAQISVFWPKGQGTVKPKQLADKLAAGFPRGADLWRNGTRVRITGPAYVSAALAEDPYYHLPVTVPWRVLT